MTRRFFRYAHERQDLCGVPSVIFTAKNIPIMKGFELDGHHT